MPGRFSWRRQDVWAITILVNFFVLALLIIFGLIYSSSPTFGIEEEALLAPASALVGVVFVWSFLSWRMVTGNFFNPYGLFLIAAALFNGGQVFLEIFNIDTSSFLEVGLSVYDEFSSATILKTTYLVALGIAAFHTGGLFSVLAAQKRNSSEIKIITEAKSALPTEKALRVVGWSLLAISLLPAILLTKQSISVVSAAGYMGMFQASVNDVIRILSGFIVPGTIFLLAGSRKLRFNIVLSWVVVLTYSSALFFVGNRGGAAMLLVAYAWVYHRCIRPLSKMLLLGVSGFVLFVVFPVIRIFRLESGPERFSPSTLLDTFSSIGNPVVYIIFEMGASMKTVAYTIELVPGHRDFDMGVSYLYALLSVIPSLLWEAHPTTVHGTLSSWLAGVVEPGMSVFEGWGLGFSFIAEAYLNFGWIGAPFALGIMGFLLGWFVMWADRSGDLSKVAVVGAFTAFLLIFARAESNDIFRYLAWYALIPYLGVIWLRSFAKPRSAGVVRHRGAKPDPATRAGLSDVRRTSS